LSARSTAGQPHPARKSRLAVKLCHIDTSFLARSEAKQLLGGLAEQFDTVEVDFTGVTDVGPSFVDELLRVWPTAHPGTTVIPVGMNAAVEFMVRRGLARTQQPDR
jgi:hypothetical protein